MRNEFGVPLDDNGYAPSIAALYDDHGNPCCIFCRRTAPPLHRHEIFCGSDRKKSKALGLWVWVCPTHHNDGPHGVHQNAEMMEHLHRYGQTIAEAIYGWDHDDFRQRFRKNYLEEETI